MTFLGIFSDIHLLAMMYSGEMCYWGLLTVQINSRKNHEMDNDAFWSKLRRHTKNLWISEK